MMTSVAHLAAVSSNAGALTIGETAGAVGVGFLFALALAAYLFFRLFRVFFGTDLMGALRS